MLGRREFLKWLGLAPVGVVGVVVGLQSRGGVGEKTPCISTSVPDVEWKPSYLTSTTAWALRDPTKKHYLYTDFKGWRAGFGSAV